MLPLVEPSYKKSFVRKKVSEVEGKYSFIVAIPNEIFSELKGWTDDKEVKSVRHQEFIYSYYFYIAYLWRYAIYGKQEINQQIIKQTLGYNPNEKRIDYLIKRDGLLDQKGYTQSTTNFPVSWSLEGKSLSFSLLDEYDEESQKHLLKGYNDNRLIKMPLKHIGDENEEGIFWNSSNTHMIGLSIFNKCIKESDVGCSGFYMYGILNYISSLNNRFNGTSDSFSCSNETLMNMTGWGMRKVIRVTNKLVDIGLIEKEQRIKIKGSVNSYDLL